MASAPHRCAGRSDRLDEVSLGTLGALAGGEFHPLVVLEATVTVSLNNGVVNEDIARAVIGGDETIALVGVEPLHCTLRHFALSPTERLSGSACANPSCCGRLYSKAGLWKSAAPAVRNFAGAVTRHEFLPQPELLNPTMPARTPGAHAADARGNRR